MAMARREKEDGGRERRAREREERARARDKTKAKRAAISRRSPSPATSSSKSKRRRKRERAPSAEAAGQTHTANTTYFPSLESRLWFPFLLILVAIALAPPPAEIIRESSSIIEEISKVIPNGEALSLSPLAFVDKLSSQWREFADANLTSSFETFYNLIVNEDKGTDSIRPGLAAAAMGVRKKYPIVIIPGATTTGLEIWKGKACAKAYFKQRLWGSMSMFSSLASMDSSCWLEHMKLNLTTGLDPEGIKVRPAEGLSNVSPSFPRHFHLSST